MDVAGECTHDFSICLWIFGHEFVESFDKSDDGSSDFQLVSLNTI